MSQYCKKCGAELMPGIGYCGFCGEKVEQTTLQTNSIFNQVDPSQKPENTGNSYSPAAFGTNPAQQQTAGQSSQYQSPYQQTQQSQQTIGQSSPYQQTQQSQQTEGQSSPYQQTQQSQQTIGQSSPYQSQYQQSQQSPYGTYEYVAGTLQQFANMPQNAQITKGINTSATICFIIAGLQAVSGFIVYGFGLAVIGGILLDVCILIGLGIGLKKTKNKICAILLAVYAALTMIINTMNGTVLGGWLIGVAAVIALINSIRLDNEWKSYKASHNIR